MTTVSMKQPIAASTYPRELIALVRSLDCAEVCVRVADHYLGNLEQDDPQSYYEGGAYPQWLHGNTMNLRATLPELRAAALCAVRLKHPELGIAANALGDFEPPTAVAAIMAPIIKNPLYGNNLGGHPPKRLLEVPARLSQSHQGRFIIFYGDAFLIPSEISDDFVEVWFRRSLGFWSDGGAYPAYLEKRPYGWQAYGVEA